MSINICDYSTVKVEQVGTLIRGVSYKSHQATNTQEDGKIPILRSNNIQTNIDLTDLVYVEDHLITTNQYLQPGDILFAMSSGSKHLVGKSIRIPAGFQGSFGAFCAAFRPSNLVDGKYAALFFHSPRFKNHISHISKGTNINNLKREHILEIEIPLPPLPIQQAIVAKLEALFSELDKGIEQLKTARQQLRTYRQAVLKAAFEGRLTGEHVTDGELPEGWKEMQLKEIAKLIGGVTKGRNLEGKMTIMLPYLRVANVQDGYLDLDEVKQIEVLETDLEKYRLQNGDVLFTEGGDKDKLGRGTVWHNEINDCIHQNHVFRGRPDQSLALPKYITYYSQSKKAKDYFYNNAKQTTNLASINLTVLGNLALPIPSITKQEQIIFEIESRLSVADKLEETIAQGLQQAEALRQSILKKAFEGELTTYKPITS